MDDPQGRVIQTAALEEHFLSEVRSAFEKQKLQAHPHTEFYLVRLLSDFSHRDNLFSHPLSEDTPLAIAYLESLNSGGIAGLRAMKRIADFALYITGFFPDSLQRKNIDLDYYAAMGGNAYRRLHTSAREMESGGAFSETFLELSDRFLNFVDVLAEISEHSHLGTDSDLLRLYEKWLCTGSERLKLKLAEFGIHPLCPQATPRSETRH